MYLPGCSERLCCSTYMFHIRASVCARSVACRSVVPAAYFGSTSGVGKLFAKPLPIIGRTRASRDVEHFVLGDTGASGLLVCGPIGAGTEGRRTAVNSTLQKLASTTVPFTIDCRQVVDKSHDDQREFLSTFTDTLLKELDQRLSPMVGADFVWRQLRQYCSCDRALRLAVHPSLDKLMSGELRLHELSLLASSAESDDDAHAVFRQCIQAWRGRNSGISELEASLRVATATVLASYRADRHTHLIRWIHSLIAASCNSSRTTKSPLLVLQDLDYLMDVPGGIDGAGNIIHDELLLQVAPKRPLKRAVQTIATVSSPFYRLPIFEHFADTDGLRFTEVCGWQLEQTKQLFAEHRCADPQTAHIVLEAVGGHPQHLQRVLLALSRTHRLRTEDDVRSVVRSITEPLLTSYRELVLATADGVAANYGVRGARFAVACAIEDVVARSDGANITYNPGTSPMLMHNPMLYELMSQRLVYPRRHPAVFQAANALARTACLEALNDLLTASPAKRLQYRVWKALIGMREDVHTFRYRGGIDSTVSYDPGPLDEDKFPSYP